MIKAARVEWGNNLFKGIKNHVIVKNKEMSKSYLMDLQINST